jgi:hypothetical protein
MTTEIINKNGKSYVVIPYETYQQLIEDAEILADIKAYDEIKEKKEENFPSYIVDKIFIQGENPIKVYREYRNLTQLELLNRVKITLKKLQEIEADISLANKEELEAIVKVLNIDIDMVIK